MIAKLLIVVDAPGPAEFIEPVIPLLKKKFEVQVVAVGESPWKILERHNPFHCNHGEDAEPMYRKFSPDALLVAMSSLVIGPYVNKRFTEIAHADGKKVVAFQDYWANHRQPQNFAVKGLWDAVLVPDELAKKLMLEDMGADKNFKCEVIVTGNPAFEKFRKVDVEVERWRLREKYKIEDDKLVILYSGQGTPQSFRADDTTFVLLKNTIHEMRSGGEQIVLIAHPHPRDMHPWRYKEIAGGEAFLYIESGLTEEILPLADIVASMYSTSLIHACFLRIPSISILLPDAGRRRLKAVSLDDFPPNLVGASIGIYSDSAEELAATIKRMADDESYRASIKEMQEKYFMFPDTPASYKVTAEVLRILK